MSLKIIFRPISKDSKEGYLKVRVIENRQTKMVSLGIKIHISDWLESKQRVSSKHPFYQEINLKIEDVIKSLAQHDNDIQVLQTTSKTILQFYQEVIDSTVNQGTKLKYINVRKKFTDYLQSINMFDLKFNQLTESKVKGFYKHMIDSGNIVDSVNYKLKSFKATINKAIKAGLVRYPNDPFINLQLKYSQKKLKFLTSDEVKCILNTIYFDKRKFHYNTRLHDLTLKEIAHTFLFQLFTQGLRCSDVQFLRWRNFKMVGDTLFIDYIMFKTKKEMSVNLTYLSLKMLEIPIIKFASNIEDELDVYERLKLDILKSKSPKMHIQISDVESDAYKVYVKYIMELATGDKRNDFVFHFLNKEDFKNFNDKEIGNLTAIQYSKFTGTRAYYNRLLKIIQEQCGINLNLTSHVARHTYSQLLLENNVNIQDICYSLGHMHLSTTQVYVGKLQSNNTRIINQILSDRFMEYAK